ncbi:MAG: hypothetical protein GF355_07095 [Candidatus Eisenbacteria bacterium]|nr:hypothetical protein [Candidatus Eisenbacteria bacterium]
MRRQIPSTVSRPPSERPKREGSRRRRRFPAAWSLIPLAALYFATLVQIETQQSASYRRSERLEERRDSLRMETLIASAELAAHLSLESLKPTFAAKGLEATEPQQVASVLTTPLEEPAPAWTALLPPELLQAAVPRAYATEEISSRTGARPGSAKGER